MKILFITIPFREYVNEIHNAMVDQLNAKVDIIYCDLHPPAYTRMVDVILSEKIKKWYNTTKQKEQFHKYINVTYDYIFVLVGRNIDVVSLKQICEEQVKAKKILYVWDDIARINTFEQIKSFFDIIYSFDSEDCRKYGFRFLPLFYCRQYNYMDDNKDLIVSSVGGLHSSRESYLHKINSFCNQYGFSNYLHLQTTWPTVLKEFLQGRRNNLPDFIRFKELSMVESSNILRRSLCAVDMPHPTQTGLTIRTIEALASKTKLITTNKAIREYDFYNENNILITDSECSNLTEEFIRKPYVKIDDSIVEKYSLDSWIRTIFKGD